MGWALVSSFQGLYHRSTPAHLFQTPAMVGNHRCLLCHARKKRTQGSWKCVALNDDSVSLLCCFLSYSGSHCVALDWSGTCQCRPGWPQTCVQPPVSALWLLEDVSHHPKEGRHTLCKWIEPHWVSTTVKLAQVRKKTMCCRKPFNPSHSLVTRIWNWTAWTTWRRRHIKCT